MYRMETLLTKGSKRILLVCSDGNGLKDFRILEEIDNKVKVGYTLLPVRTMYTKVYFSILDRIQIIEQSYYLLDLEKKKIFRVGRISSSSRIDNGVKTKKIYLGKYPGTKCSIRTTRNYHYFEASITDKNGLRPFTTDVVWVDPENMPGTMNVVTFAHGKTYMQNVSCTIFLH